MKYNLIEEEKWHRKLEITIPEEDVTKKFGEVYDVLKKEAKIPGFRPGKAPMNIIKSRYGKLAEKEVLETMVPDAYSDAIKESGVFPISEPIFTAIVVEDGKPITFAAEFDVKPVYELQKYTGYSLKKQSGAVQDIEVEKAFNRMIDQYSSLKAKDDQPAAEGDLVIVDMDKTNDPDNAIKDDKLTDFTFELNKDVTLPGFIDNLVGKKAGETADVDINYPEDYFDKNMAGKHLSFHVTVKEVKEIIRPELNEEFFKQFPEISNADELKSKLREEIEGRRKQEVESDLREQIIKSVISSNDFEMPESLIDNYLDSIVEDFRKQNQNKDVDEMEIRENYRTLGIRFIRWNLLYHKIAEKENIAVSKEDTDKWLQNFADKSNVSLEQAKEFLAQQRKIQDIKETILEDKVIDFIMQSSTIEDV